jgi:hypothetical protein
MKSMVAESSEEDKDKRPIREREREGAHVVEMRTSEK